MSAPDPRLTDDRVKSTRKPEWDQHPDEWNVSNLDRMDGVGVDETVFPPARPVRVDSLPVPGRVVERHTGFGVRLVAVAVLVTVCAVLGLAVVGFAHLAGWVA